MVPLKDVSNFWRTLKMPLINCKINLILIWSANCFLVAGAVANQVLAFTVTDTKLYVSVVTLSTQDNGKQLKQSESGFKRTINWNKDQSKMTMQARYRYLDFLVDPSFQGANGLFVLSFENEKDRRSYKRYYLPTVEVEDYNVMIIERNFFHQPVKTYLRTYGNIRKNSNW